NWSTAANWDNDVLPVFPVAVTLAGTTRLNPTNDLTGISANSLTFNGNAGAFQLSGNSLGLYGGINFSGNPASLLTQTLNLPLNPGNALLVDTRPNGNITINGSITGPGTELTQTDTGGNLGILTLAGTNNTLKGLVINNGTNRITGTTTVNGIGGSSFFYLANGQTSRTATLILENGANLTVNGPFQDAAVIGRDGGSGTIIQNGGTFNFNINDGNHGFLFVGASGNAATRSVYNMNGGVLDMNGYTLGIALGANTVITGMVNQVGGLITNVGTLFFSPNFAQGHSIYNLTGGTLAIGNGGMAAFSGAVYEVNLGGGTITAETSWSSSLNLNLTGNNGAVTFNPAGNTITLSGSLSGTGGLKLTGSGLLQLSGANTYSGDTLVDNGSTLELDTTGSSAGAFRLANGALVNLNFSGNYAVGSFYTNGVALAVGTYNAGNLPNFLTGSGNLQVTSGISTGRWTGSGANNYWSTGANWDNNAVPIFPHAITLAGSSRLNNTNDLSGISLSAVTFDSAAGAFHLQGNDVTLSGGIGFNGNPTAPVTQTLNCNLTLTGDQNINLPVNGTLSLGGSINSGFNLTKSGNGTLVLGGTSDNFSGYDVTGGTNIITGNVTFAGTGSSRFYVGDIGTVGNLVIQPGATVNVTGNFADAGVIGRDSGSGTIIQNGGAFNFNPGNVGYLFVGASSSAATRAEYHMNGGTLDLNNYTLAVALSANGGTLITGVVNQVGGTINNVGTLNLGSFTFGPGRGIYDLSGGSIYLGANGIKSDSGIYEVRLGGGTVGAYAGWSSSLNMTLTGSNGPVTFDTAGNLIHLTGILSGPGGFNLIGGGSLELNGGNSYTGDVNVNGATLVWDSPGSSAGALRLVDGSAVQLN
ncbi:MAG TPA: autotransporter-associated beta strand repeat-containing protein, partial [Verrucomicrobiae bacterium]